MLTVLIIFLTVTTANCNIQDGTWQSNYTNNNFLFSFLQANHGTASIHAQERTLSVYLQSYKYNGRIIKMEVDTLTPAYVTDAVYQDFNKSIKITFVTDKQITYSNQQAKASKIFYNIILNHRSKLQLISAEGQFTIQLIDIEVIYPQLLMQLNIKVTELLGYCSIQILIVWSYKFLANIALKSQYFSSTYLRRLLQSLSSIGMPITIAQLILIMFTMFTIFALKFKARQKCLLFLIRIFYCVSQLFLVFDLVKIRLMHLIIASCLYQLVTMLLNINLKINLWQLIGHTPLYILPIAVFPYFSQQINYPKEQAACWWFYLTSFAFQVLTYKLKANGGIWIKLKRCRYYVRKWRQTNVYTELKENLCPVCFQEIEIENAAVSGIAIGVEKYFRNSCNHCFHKECIKNEYIQKVCFFDNEKWSSEMLQPKKGMIW